MEGEIKVRAVDFEEKSVAEVEEQLLKQHDESNVVATEPVETIETVVDTPNSVETIVDEIDDNKVLSYIGKRYNRDINNLDELFEQRQQNEELPEDVSAFLKYKTETGRGMENFIQLSKNYEEMDDESLLF